MSRFRYYVQSLISGYVVVIANVLYTLLSVPLALRFLSEAEFGLWALATQIGFYMALLDFGITGAMARILIDYKDPISKGAYGSLVKTGIAVNSVQGLMVAVFGVAAAFSLGPLLDVPSALTASFRILVIGQCAILAASFVSKIFWQILVAHQRSDIINYWQSLALFVSLGVLWLCFEKGAGIYSVVWAQAAAFVIGAFAASMTCFHLRFWPSRESLGSFDWGKFRELFAFGKDIFLFSLGSLLVHSSHVIVISKTLGLEAAAVWSICTRSFTLMGQLVGRVLDFSAAPLSEMFVRGERERLLQRFRGITVLSTSMAVAAGLTFASCNQPFVSVWAGKHLSWSSGNDILLAFWFVLMTIQRCHIGLLGIMKEIQVAKFVYFGEGIAFLVMGFLLARPFEFPAIIAASIICTMASSLSYGLHKTRRQFGLAWRDLFYGWLWPALRLLLVAAPLVVGLYFATELLGDVAKLGVRAVLVPLIAGAALWRWGVDSSLQREIVAKSPAVLRAALNMTLKPFEIARKKDAT